MSSVKNPGFLASAYFPETTAAVRELKQPVISACFWQEDPNSNLTFWHFVTHAYGRDLVIDSAGNVYVTGDNALPSMRTIKLNPDGGAEWSQSIAGFKHLQARAIAIDSSGNVIVTGYAGREDYNPDFLTVKYNSSGAEQWIAWHGGAYGDMPADMVVDRAGNIYLTGTDSDSVYHSDYSLHRAIFSAEFVEWNLY